MQIVPINKNKLYISFSASNSDYNRLSGKKCFENYDKKYTQINTVKNQKIADVQGVIYDSMQSLISYGKYNTAKFLFKEIENEDELKTDYELYKTVADVYKKENDLIKAKELYETALVNCSKDNLVDYVAIEKDYLETQLLLNKNVDDALLDLEKREDAFSNVSFLELDSLNNLKKGNYDVAKMDIMSAYLIAENNDILSDDLLYKAAIVYANEGNYSKSNEIIKTRLDKLNKENKVYTYEFLKYLTLLGINNCNDSLNYDDEKSVELINLGKITLQNAREIEKVIPNPQLRDSINYNLLKLEFNAPDFPLLSRVNTFLENTQNYNYKKDLSILAGDYCVSEDKELASFYYKNAELFINKLNNVSSSELLSLYNKIVQVSPELKGEYTAKICNLNDKKDLSIRQLVDVLEYSQKSKDLNSVLKTVNEIIENKECKEELKEIARTYKLFINIGRKESYYHNISLLNTNLSKLVGMYEKNKDKALGVHLYNSYTKLANVNYDSSDYYNAAISATNAQKYIAALNPTKDDTNKSKVLLTMLWYKAKDYYEAEKSCLDYFKSLTGENYYDLINKSVPEILKSKNDYQSRQIAATIETLGIINLKNRNYTDAKNYYKKAIEIRENLAKKDLFLANDYAALARIAILGYWDFSDEISSKDLHKKCLAILKDKYPTEKITADEEAFHKKYYGFSLTSAAKFLPGRDKTSIIDNFK